MPFLMKTDRAGWSFVAATKLIVNVPLLRKVRLVRKLARLIQEGSLIDIVALAGECAVLTGVDVVGARNPLSRPGADVGEGRVAVDFVDNAVFVASVGVVFVHSKGLDVKERIMSQCFDD